MRPPVSDITPSLRGSEWKRWSHIVAIALPDYSPLRGTKNFQKTKHIHHTVKFM
jgi:hypothetical protein